MTTRTWRGLIYIGTSVDGMIARRDGTLDWLTSLGAAAGDAGYIEFSAQIDTMLIGRGTYDTILTFGEWPYAGSVSSSSALPGRPTRTRGPSSYAAWTRPSNSSTRPGQPPSLLEGASARLPGRVVRRPRARIIGRPRVGGVIGPRARGPLRPTRAGVGLGPAFGPVLVLAALVVHGGLLGSVEVSGAARRPDKASLPTQAPG